MTIDELLNKIKEMASNVYLELGGGYIESAYENAMAVEFRHGNLIYDVQKTTEIFYKGEKVGEHQLDFIVSSELVVELKAVTSISKSHIAQLKSYLRTLKLSQGVVINFPYPDKDCPEFEIVNLDVSK